MRNAIHQFATAPRYAMLASGEHTPESLVDHLIHLDVKATRRDVAADWREQAADYLAVQKPRKRRDWYDKPAHSRL